MSDEPPEQPQQPPPMGVAAELAAIARDLAIVTENVTSLSVRVRLADVADLPALMGIDGPPPATETAAQRLRVQLAALDRALELVADEIRDRVRHLKPSDAPPGFAPPMFPPPATGAN
jgi:hypothetical protein